MRKRSPHFAEFVVKSQLLKSMLASMYRAIHGFECTIFVFVFLTRNNRRFCLDSARCCATLLCCAAALLNCTIAGGHPGCLGLRLSACQKAAVGGTGGTGMGLSKLFSGSGREVERGRDNMVAQARWLNPNPLPFGHNYTPQSCANQVTDAALSWVGR